MILFYNRTLLLNMKHSEASLTHTSSDSLVINILYVLLFITILYCFILFILLYFHFIYFIIFSFYFYKLYTEYIRKMYLQMYTTFVVLCIHFNLRYILFLTSLTLFYLPPFEPPLRQQNHPKNIQFSIARTLRCFTQQSILPP